MNLPALPLALPVERPTPPPPPQEAPSEASGRGARRDDAFEQALQQQLGRPRAGWRPAGEFASGLQPWWAQPLETMLGVSEPAGRGEEREEGLMETGLSALLRPTAPTPVAREDEVPATPVVPPPVWITVPLPPSATGPGEPAPVTAAELPRAVLGQVRWTVDRQQPVTQLEFQLMPPALGPVNLQVTYTGGVVGVQLMAHTLAARQALESQTGQIQAILHGHNLTPGSVRIVAPTSGRAGASGAGLRQDPGGLGAGLQGRRRQPGGADAAIERA